jgi:hypothetical protein
MQTARVKYQRNEQPAEAKIGGAKTGGGKDRRRQRPAEAKTGGGKDRRNEFLG